MSRIGSSSGVRVATQPLSTVYTVLLLIAVLALVVAIIYAAMTLQSNYGGTLGYGDEVEQDVERARAFIRSASQELDTESGAIERFPGGGAPATPTPLPAEPAGGESAT